MESQYISSVTPASTPSQRTQGWLVMLCASSGMFLVALDISVNVALPAITSHFSTDIQTVQWIIVSFVATRAGLAVAAGNFGDTYGLKRVFLVGVLLYTLAVIVISFAPSLHSIFGLRVLQGVGSGILYALAPAIAGLAVSSAHRGRAMGAVTGGYALGTMAGTLGTGFLIGVFGWEAAFLGRVPFCILAVALGWFVMKGDRVSGPRRAFDLVGSVSLVGTVVSLVLALHLGSRTGWDSPLVIGFLAATPLLLGMFIRSELRASWPVLDLQLLRIRSFLAPLTSMLFVHWGAFVLWFVFPFYVSDALGRGSLSLGIMLAIMAGAMSAAAPVSGWLSERTHPRHVASVGTLIVALGLGWMSLLDDSSSLVDVGMRIGVAGFGLGLFQAAAYTLALAALAPNRLGTGSGALSLAQATGAVVSVAVGGLVFALRTDDHTAALALAGFAGGDASRDALAMAFQDTFRIAALVALGGAALLLIAVRTPGPDRDRP